MCPSRAPGDAPRANRRRRPGGAGGGDQARLPLVAPSERRVTGWRTACWGGDARDAARAGTRSSPAIGTSGIRGRRFTTWLHRIAVNACYAHCGSGGGLNRGWPAAPRPTTAAARGASTTGRCSSSRRTSASSSLVLTAEAHDQIEALDLPLNRKSRLPAASRPPPRARGEPPPGPPSKLGST